MREQMGQGVEGFFDGLPLNRCGAFQGFDKRVEGELGHARGEELADGTGGDEEGDATVGGVSFALEKTLFDEAVDDAGDGAVGEADGVAEVFEAEAVLGADEGGHDETLRAGEIAAGELGLEALAHASLDGVELALGVLGEGAEFG